MAVNMIDLVLPVCAAKAAHLADWDYVKGKRAFRRKVGMTSWVDLRPNWHFPRGLPQASAGLNIAVGNTVFEKTYKKVFGDTAPPAFGTQFHILDREMLKMRKYVVERGSWVDKLGEIPFPERTFYHDELDGWLDDFIATGWRLVQGRFDLSTDRTTLQGCRTTNDFLGHAPRRLMIDIMLGNSTAASQYLQTPDFMAQAPHNARLAGMIATLAAAERSIQTI